MPNPKEQMARLALTQRLAKVVKRQRYDERQVVQILRVTPEKAKAIVAGQVDGFPLDELQHIVTVLE